MSYPHDRMKDVNANVKVDKIMNYMKNHIKAQIFI